MFNCDNQKKVVAFFSSKINPKNIIPDFMRKNRSVDLYRDPLECVLVSVFLFQSQCLQERHSLNIYKNNTWNALTFQLILLKEDTVCCIHLFYRAFFKNPIAPCQFIFEIIKSKGIICMCFLSSEKEYEVIHLLFF